MKENIGLIVLWALSAFLLGLIVEQSNKAVIAGPSRPASYERGGIGAFKEGIQKFTDGEVTCYIVDHGTSLFRMSCVHVPKK